MTHNGWYAIKQQTTFLNTTFQIIDAANLLFCNQMSTYSYR